jgi:hypothetical protein
MNLETEPMSLLEYVTRSKRLYDAHQDASFCQYTMTGIHDNIQTVVDPILNRVDEFEELIVTRDYDSMLAMSRKIHVKAALTMHPLSKREDHLTNDVHIEYRFCTENVRSHMLKLRKPANIVSTIGPVHRSYAQSPSLVYR